MFFLAFNSFDLTSRIPYNLRNVFMRNAIILSFLDKGITYKFELNSMEKQKLNYVLSQMGNVISGLTKFPNTMLQHLKFSELISGQLSDIYHSTFPEVLKRALIKAHKETKFVWNFLIAIRTGKHHLIKCY